MPRIGDRVGRRERPLTGEDVQRLPEGCSTCLFWELGTACPAPRTTALPGWRRIATPSRPDIRKQAWVSARVQEDGPPGRIVEIDDEVVAYVLFGPSASFAVPGATVPRPSREALLLATLWVRPTEREAGIGRLLVRSAIKEAVRLGRPAVEAYGDRRFFERGCVLPAFWLLHEGFRVHAEHPRTPLFRLDVRRTARWTDSLENAWEEVLGRLPHPSPARDPVQGSVGRTSTSN
jgi:GNAT superfamily N-acetyltransferase